MSIKINVRDNQVDRAYKMLKKSRDREGIIKTMRNLQAYCKPSIAKRRKEKEARKFQNT